MIQAIHWDKQEFFTAANGKLCVRYAVSDCDGVICETSMHDPTIQSMYPPEFWLPVHSAPVNTARIDYVDGWLVALFGFGKPGSDPTGNLILVRVLWRPGFCPQRLNQIAARIRAMLDKFGIEPHLKMEETIRGN